MRAIFIEVFCSIMNYSEAIISGTLLGLFMAISVGPTLFAVINYSMHHSYKAGLAFVLGVSLSDITFVTLANFASRWLAFLESHQRTVGFLGASLFIIMGLVGFFKKYKPKKRPKPSQQVSIPKRLYAKIFSSGFLMNSLNPAVILIWMGAVVKVSLAESLASEQMSAKENIIYRILFFGVCLSIVLGIDFLKVFLADRIRHWLTLRKIMYFNKISALCILAFGLILFFGLLLKVQV